MTTRMIDKSLQIYPHRYLDLSHKEVADSLESVQNKVIKSKSRRPFFPCEGTHYEHVYVQLPPTSI